MSSRASLSGDPVSGGPLSGGPGWLAFQAGLFLLPSSALLAAIPLFVSCVAGSRGRQPSLWQDRWMVPLLFASVLMVIGACMAETGGLAWAGLANWIPFFWGFWAFRPFLDGAERRQRAARWLLAGTVPVLVTGFGQMLFGWSGPWQCLGGAIVWFLGPGGQPEGRLSGLFDYANVAGAWLGVIWPFSLAAVLHRRDPRWCRGLALLLSASIVAAVILTRSRNAMAALIVAVPWVLGPLQWGWLFPLLLLATAPILLIVWPGAPTGLQQWAADLLPDGVRQRLLEKQATGSLTRLAQWRFGLDLIAQRPWLGWGAAAFSVLYPIHAQRKWHGHSHNLPLELGVSHGLPVTVLVVGVVLALLVLALRQGILRSATMDRAWWAATLVLVAMHASDLPFFDSRLNILGWVLLAGLCGFNQESWSDSGPDRDAPAVLPESADP